MADTIEEADARRDTAFGAFNEALAVLVGTVPGVLAAEQAHREAANRPGIRSGLTVNERMGHYAAQQLLAAGVVFGDQHLSQVIGGPLSRHDN